jgi:hypothetical protein
VEVVAQELTGWACLTLILTLIYSIFNITVTAMGLDKGALAMAAQACDNKHHSIA